MYIYRLDFYNYYNNVIQVQSYFILIQLFNYSFIRGIYQEL